MVEIGSAGFAFPVRRNVVHRPRFGDLIMPVDRPIGPAGRLCVNESGKKNGEEGETNEEI